MAYTPVRRLTVLYDAECPLCTHLRNWLVKQRQLVPLDLVPAGSQEARRRFPGIDHGRTLDEITVVGDGGQVYQGPAAWVVCLWALAEHRPMAHRVASHSGARFARAVLLAAAKYREGQRRPEGWGGGVYRRADGWTYHPQHGWSYAGPEACDPGRCPTG
ncbi:DCC1-like thiol-disulfide oxidoreductase family protein [Streptomyces sp. N35]|uniref:thiol-disulfide oxidoreductase DCC family protein n=1 Tax=Streptomyces sp. N35 TaxID=2795730 RepID=UPI0027DC3A36|nr:DCC1-like thiol-disulfide oxidoreductase family protein [Streptomyces sp. N35]